MLSYRHAFHAGNHADVLKHAVQTLILRHLLLKDKPFCCIDTHAAGGIYRLGQGYSAQNAEYQSGISLIYDHEKLRALLPEYYAAIDSLNSSGSLENYPGSPYIAQSLLRQKDKLYLYDLHKAEFEALLKNFGKDKRVQINLADGFAAMSSLLPPPIRRGLVLMDPSYELKSDYYAAIKAIKQGLSRFNVGIFALWYPVLARMHDHSRNLVQEAKRLNVPLLQVEMRVRPQGEERGMCGSGMLVFNYPFGLYEELEAVITELYPLLCTEDGSAKLKILNAKA